MSVRRNSVGSRPTNPGRYVQTRMSAKEPNIDPVTNGMALSNILPELMKNIRKLLPQEIPLNIYVHNVEYSENRSERLTGTLYLTTFRLVFAPDQETKNNKMIFSGNKYISEYDIPLASIYKIQVAPVDSRSGFKSFLNENQIQTEIRTFTLITRDFRNITFTKCSVTKSNTGFKHHQTSATKMETFIDALRVHSRFQGREQLYPYLAIHQNLTNSLSPRSNQDFTSGNTRSTDDDTADFSLSNDERIKGYLTYYDWKDELHEAQEEQWTVDRSKFNGRYIVQGEGPYVRLANSEESDGDKDLIWHWTHIVQIENNHYSTRKTQKHMLITVPGIGEITIIDPLRRTTTDTNLVSSSHYIHNQPFQRYNLAKFPCNLKRLQASYEKLIEICVIIPEDDDEKWWSKLNACKWLKYVSKTLHGATSLAKLLGFKNIELAGSDTDNNCLMSSLIQILLRPKCRTIKGFCELIVREWLIRGHKFCERFGQVLYDVNGYSAQESPVFLLFLDCVHQLIVQNPFAFEFTDYFLLELYHNVCYCYHHTFAFNTIVDRLNAIHSCPRDLLILSSFDFSLYLQSDAVRLLKNDASIINLQKSPSSFQERIKSQIEPAVNRAPSTPSRRPKSTSFIHDDSINHELLPVNSHQYEYDTIESPQIFLDNLHVDWRAFNLVLWSKCYCRYDEPYMPTSYEQQLSYDIHSLKDDMEKISTKTKQHITLDTFHYVGHANSWHPQSLDTRI